MIKRYINGRYREFKPLYNAIESLFIAAIGIVFFMSIAMGLLTKYF